VVENHKGLNNYIKLVLLFIAGAVLPLAFAPVDLIVFAYLSPAALFLSLINVSVATAFWRSYIFGLGVFGVGVSWVFVAINEFGNTPILLAVLLTFCFVAFVALVIAFQGMFSVWVLNLFRETQYYLVLALVLILPLNWLMFEWIRGTIFTGFPWLNLGYSQIDTSLTGYAAVLGVYGISWLVAVCAGQLILMWNNFCLAKWKYLSINISVIISIFVVGLFLNKVEWTNKVDLPLTVSLVQGNAPQITKWDVNKINDRLNIYKSLTELHWDSDIIIWPENSLTLFYRDPIIKEFLEPIEKTAGKHNTDLLIGLPVQNKSTGQYYSTFVSLGRTPGIYKKTHLVPFGEFIPFEDLFRGLIAFLDLPMSGFSRGEKNQTLLKAGGQTLAVTICYEDAFGEELIRQLPEATLLVNGSNNAWYGDSFAPHQHLQISRMRAIETGRELMRVTTNGISAFISKDGRLLQTSPQFKPFVLTAKVQPRNGATPYVVVGNTPILLIFLLFIIFILIQYKFKLLH